MKRCDSQVSPEVRAKYFRALAQLENAGIPVDQALEALLKSEPTRRRRSLGMVVSLVRSGVPLAAAGKRVGLFNEFEARLLNAAAHAGTLGRQLTTLAARYEIQLRRSKRIKTRMALPAGVLALACLVAPLPGLILNQYGILTYFLRALSPLAAVLALLGLFKKMKQLRSRRNCNTFFARLSLQMPLFGELARKRAQRDLLSNLAMLWAAGVPALEAIRVALDTVGNAQMRAAYSDVAKKVEAGSSVADALLECGALDSEQGYAFASTGEFSGSLDTMLMHHAASLDDDINRSEDWIAEWMPQLAYALVSAFVISQIF